jgi:ubiquinone biosynthesis protein UbiJ
MSSPLDARMRVIAREVAEALAAGGPVQVLETTGPDRVDALAKEVAALRSAVDRMNARLDALSAAAPARQDVVEAKPARRTRRTAGTGE